MKKLSVILFILFALIISSCGVKEKIEQKVGEKIVEGIVGNDDVDVDIDEEKITIEGKDGETLTVGGYEWPDIDYLPEFKKGEIISVSKDKQGNVTVIINKVEQKDYEDYQKLLKEDFTEETNEFEIDEYLLYEGKNSEGYSVVSQYFKEDNSFMIIGKKNSE